MTSPAIVVLRLINCWSRGFDSEKPGNILHSLDLHIIEISRKIQQVHVCTPCKREVAVEALASWTIVPTYGKFRLGLTRSLDQVGPVKRVAPKREHNIRVKSPMNRRQSLNYFIVRGLF